jgi:transcriptional regulator with XRE-family HTH domain
MQGGWVNPSADRSEIERSERGLGYGRVIVVKRSRSGGGSPANPLQRLIRDRLAETGWSYPEAAARGGLPKSTLHHLANGTPAVRAPSAATLDAVARALDLPLRMVQEAAAEAAGLRQFTPKGLDGTTRELIAAVPELSDEDREHLLALVRSMLATNRSRSGSPRRRSARGSG